MQIAANPQSSPHGRGSSAAKRVKNQLTIDDADDKTKKTKDQPVFYVINYEGGGYKIISADDRLEPILADVPGGSAIDKTSKLPGGLLMWMKATKEQIQTIRKVKLSRKAKKGSRKMSGIIASKDPLLRTRWNQYAGRFTPGWPTFNHSIPYGCPNTDPATLGGNAYVGCVGVAVAQVVRYWGMQNPSFRTPYQYTWDSMPLDPTVIDSYFTEGPGRYATDEIARLMADAAREVHTIGVVLFSRTVAKRQFWNYSGNTLPQIARG